MRAAFPLGAGTRGGWRLGLTQRLNEHISLDAKLTGELRSHLMWAYPRTVLQGVSVLCHAGCRQPPEGPVKAGNAWHFHDSTRMLQRKGAAVVKYPDRPPHTGSLLLFKSGRPP